MNDFLKDRLKEVLSAGLSAAIPAGVWKWSNMFPFINPQIPADLGLLPLAAAVIIGLLVCYYTREPRPQNPPTRSSKLFVIVGIVVMILGSVFMIFLSSQTVPIDPNWESLNIHFAYFFFVVGAGAPIGWIVARAF